MNKINVWEKNMHDAVQNEINKLKRLVQFKNTDEVVLEKAAQKNVVLRELVESSNFIDAEEKKLAKKIFEAYLEQSSFENYSDLSTLSMLVYNEVLAGRLQKTINGLVSKDGKSYVSDKLIKSLSDLTNQILSLKTKLGIDKEEKLDEFTSLQLLTKRFHQHIQENRNEFTLSVPFSCASCGKEDVKLVLLRKRVKDFDVLDHPFFAGRFYYNAEIISDVKKGLITAEQAARYIKSSPDFIKWCIDNEGRIIQNTENK
jgi:hypothetical protein